MLPQGFSSRDRRAGEAQSRARATAFPAPPTARRRSGRRRRLDPRRQLRDRRPASAAPRRSASTRTAAITAAYRILGSTSANCAGGPTPWGTWLSGEEFERGQVWECDPTGATPGSRARDGRLPARGVLRGRRSTSTSTSARTSATAACTASTPFAYPDLAAGMLEVACDSRAAVVMEAGPRPGRGGTPLRNQVAGRRSGSRAARGSGSTPASSTSSRRPTRRSTSTTPHRQELSILYRAADVIGTPLTGSTTSTSRVPATSSSPRTYGAPDPLDVCIITPEQRVSRFLKMTGRPRRASEVVGITFDPSGTRFYVGSQRYLGAGASTRSRGPFRQIPGRTRRPRRSRPRRRPRPRCPRPPRRRDTDARRAADAAAPDRHRRRRSGSRSPTLIRKRPRARAHARQGGDGPRAPDRADHRTAGAARSRSLGHAQRRAAAARCCASSRPRRREAPARPPPDADRQPRGPDHDARRARADVQADGEPAARSKRSSGLPQWRHGRRRARAARGAARRAPRRRRRRPPARAAGLPRARGRAAGDHRRARRRAVGGRPPGRPGARAAVARLAAAARARRRGAGGARAGRLPADVEVDAQRFERLVATARARARRPRGRRALREALALWRGPALADLVDYRFAARRRAAGRPAGRAADRVAADCARPRRPARRSSRRCAPSTRCTSGSRRS